MIVENSDYLVEACRSRMTASIRVATSTLPWAFAKTSARFSAASASVRLPR
jgi:hypothetical protein